MEWGKGSKTTVKKGSKGRKKKQRYLINTERGWIDNHRAVGKVGHTRYTKYNQLLNMENESK